LQYYPAPCPAERSNFTTFVDGSGNQLDDMQGVFSQQSTREISDLADGTSNVIAAAEVTMHGFKWGGWCRNGSGQKRLTTETAFRPAFVPACSPNPIECNASGRPWVDPAGGSTWPFPSASPYAYNPTFLSGCGINAEWPGAHSLHPGGINALRADGSVDFTQETMQWAVWAKLVAINDGNTVSE
jgi:prepilin-type processing-associated H-X9-DG protein